MVLKMRTISEASNSVSANAISFCKLKGKWQIFGRTKWVFVSHPDNIVLFDARVRVYTSIVAQCLQANARVEILVNPFSHGVSSSIHFPPPKQM